MRAAEYSEIASLSVREGVCLLLHLSTPHYTSCGSLISEPSDYKDDGTNVLLDANENAYGPALALNERGALEEPTVNGNPQIDFLGLNRYPDP
jgi:hypothetical protein